MDQELSVEERWAKLTAGRPKPVNPLPLELKEQILREMEWESDEEYFILEFLEMQERGCCSGDELLEALDGKEIWWPPPY